MQLIGGHHQVIVHAANRRPSSGEAIVHAANRRPSSGVSACS